MRLEPGRQSRNIEDRRGGRGRRAAVGGGIGAPELAAMRRGTLLINPEGVVKTAEIHDNAIARDMAETLRKLKAAQYVAKNPGQVCPAKWNEGAETLTPSLDLVGKI